MRVRGQLVVTSSKGKTKVLSEWKFSMTEKLIRSIKDEFEMTIDIEKLINDIDEDGSGEIEYDEFRNLLSSSD